MFALRIHLTIKLAPRKSSGYDFKDRNCDDVKDGYVSCLAFQVINEAAGVIICKDNLQIDVIDNNNKEPLKYKIFVFLSTVLPAAGTAASLSYSWIFYSRGGGRRLIITYKNTKD